PRAEPLPAGRAEALRALRGADLRQLVLLEGADVSDKPTPSATFREAQVAAYRPNRVEVEVDAPADRWLGLADVGYPGWGAAVDGAPAEVYRADYAFRAVRVGAGSHRVTFTFDPPSYRAGKAVTLAAMVGLAALTLLAVFWRGRGRRAILP